MMKRKILISIRPEYVKQILNGIKKYEYRKAIAKQDVSSMLIYETSPIMKIVAEVEIKSVLSYSPDILWDLTCDYSGISKEFFDGYFKNKKIAYAYKLGRVKVFNEPRLLSDYGLKSAPQSFVYIE